MCVAACVPILFVRVLYSLIFVITANMTWNAVKGNPTAYLLMTMIPEVALVALCIFTIRWIAPASGEAQNGKYQHAQEEGEMLTNRV